MGDKSRKYPKLRFPGFTDPWEQRKLGEVVDVRDGTHSSPRYVSNGYPLITSKNLTNQGLNFDDISFISEYDYIEINKRSKVDIGDIVFGMIGTIGNPVLVKSRGFAIKNVALIKQSSLIKNSWLLQYFKSGNFYRFVQKSNAGNTQKFIALSTIKNMNITMPTLKEQSMIGNSLNCIDNLIAANQREGEKLKNLKKSYMIKLFPKNGKKFPELRFPGFTDAWEQRKLNEVVSRRSKTSKSNSLPTVEFEDINSGVGTLNKNIYRKSSHKSGIMFISGDILFGKLRPYLKNWLHPNFTGIAVGDFWVFDPQNNDGSFIYYLIQSPKYCEISNLSIGSKMPRSDWQIVSNTFFHIPNVEEQSFIGKIIKYIDNLIAANQREAEKLKNIKQSYLNELFV